MLLPSGNNPIKCHEEVLSLQPMIPPKRFDVFSPTGGCSEGLDGFIFFFIVSNLDKVVRRIFLEEVKGCFVFPKYADTLELYNKHFKLGGIFNVNGSPLHMRQ